MINIGEKIKQLRKERKMTLAEVAGDKLSKGMLSLIENGKAQPSMESLQHIAKQLQLEVSELMQTKDQSEIRALYIKIEPLFVKLNTIYEDAEHDKKCQEILQMIQPIMMETPITGATFEEIRLSEIELFMRYYLKLEWDIEEYEEVVERYKQIDAHSKVVSGYRTLGGFAFNEREYNNFLIITGPKYGK